MKVFVTGATGFVGTAVVKELLLAGHSVLGLARSEASAKKLQEAGAEVHYGDLENLPSIIAGVQAADAVIHLGFIHDFSRFQEVCAIDKKVIETIGETLMGTNKPFIITSGTGVAVKEGILTEDYKVTTVTNPRIASEIAADALAAKGVKIAVMRLSPSVHGEGDAHGFISIVINIAKEKGKVAFIDKGDNVWPAVNRLDAAKLYVLAIEKDFEPGTRYHAVDDEGVAFKDIATIMANKLALPLVSLTKEEAQGYFTWFTHFAMFNNLSSSALTKAALHWQPTHPSLLEDLESGIYFK